MRRLLGRLLLSLRVAWLRARVRAEIEQGRAFPVAVLVARLGHEPAERIVLRLLRRRRALLVHDDAVASRWLLVRRPGLTPEVSPVWGEAERAALLPPVPNERSA